VREVGGRNHPPHVHAGNQPPQRFKFPAAHRRVQQVTHIGVRQERQQTLTPLNGFYSWLGIREALCKQVDGREREGLLLEATAIRRQIERTLIPGRGQAWQRVGGFPDLRAAEDLIFMEAVEKQGFKIGYAPGATAVWQLQPTLGATFGRFVTYSRHNVWAGRQRYWHYGIARHYAVALLLLVLAVVHSWWWLCVLVIGMVARVLKSIWKNRAGRGLMWALNPIRFGYVTVIILAIDLATFTGWLQARVSKPPEQS